MRGSVNNQQSAPSPRAFEFQGEIPLAEFDLGGVLYHGNYFRYYERAREAFLAANNTSYATLIEQGFHLVVTESQQKFIRPIRYGDAVVLKLSATQLRQASVTLKYNIYSKNVQIHTAWTRHALIQTESNQFKLSRFSEVLHHAFCTIVEG